MKTMKLWRKSRLSESHANMFANGRARAIYVIVFVMLAAFSLASCSSNDSEQDKPFTVCPKEQIKFFVCETSGETRGETAVIDTLFTEDDIEWFNISTREIRFKKQDEQLFNKLMKNYHKEGLEFRLGENVLFEVSRFVSDFDSRIFYDHVLHYSTIGKDEGNARLLPSTVHQRRAHAGQHQEECRPMGDLYDVS